MNGKDKTQLITKPLNLRFRISNCRPSRVFLTPQILDWNYYCFCFKIIFNKFLQLRVLFAAVHLINTEWGVFFINLKRTQSLSTVAAKSCRHIHKLNAKRKKSRSMNKLFPLPAAAAAAAFFRIKVWQVTDSSTEQHLPPLWGPLGNQPYTCCSTRHWTKVTFSFTTFYLSTPKHSDFLREQPIASS